MSKMLNDWPQKMNWTELNYWNDYKMKKIGVGNTKVKTFWNIG